jgi:predicted lipid-binding transport protein (Tim44 family)
MQGMDISTIIFAIIAIFVVWKLRSVLGQRTGSERPPYDPAARPNLGPQGADGAANSNNVVQLPASARAGAIAPSMSGTETAFRWTGFAEPGSAVAAGLDAIAAADRNFRPDSFVGGARGAYEMIVTAFAAGDSKALGALLAPEVLDNFSKAIRARAADGQTVQTTLVSIDSASIVDARLNGCMAQVAVRFAAKLVSATRDKSGGVIEGSAQTPGDHLDVWTFSRDTRSSDPNWRLSATETVH